MIINNILNATESFYNTEIIENVETGGLADSFDIPCSKELNAYSNFYMFFHSFSGSTGAGGYPYYEYISALTKDYVIISRQGVAWGSYKYQADSDSYKNRISFVNKTVIFSTLSGLNQYSRFAFGLIREGNSSTSSLVYYMNITFVGVF